MTVVNAQSLTPRQLMQLMLDTSHELDEAQAFLRAASVEDAKASDEYRKAWATSMMTLSGSVGGDGKRLAVAEKEARVEQGVGDLHYAKDLAENMKSVAQEAVRNKRQQLSALQSVASAVKAELELGRTGPEGGY